MTDTSLVTTVRTSHSVVKGTAAESFPITADPVAIAQYPELWDSFDMADEKKLLRSKTERILAGVGGGVADYLGTSPGIVRVIWVVLTPLTGGLALLAYILLWLLVPEEQGED